MNKKAFTLLMIFGMWITAIASANAGVYIGIAQGIHLNGEDINDTHPYIGAQKYGFGVIVYQNSFDKVGVAPYYEFSDKDGFLRFSLKAGVTTGYNPLMPYGGHTYHLDRRFFFNKDIMLFLVPMVSFHDLPISLDLSLLGDSLNLGATFYF